MLMLNEKLYYICHVIQMYNNFTAIWEIYKSDGKIKHTISEQAYVYMILRLISHDLSLITSVNNIHKTGSSGLSLYKYYKDGWLFSHICDLHRICFCERSLKAYSLQDI
jgi:hypothetical protein